MIAIIAKIREGTEGDVADVIVVLTKGSPNPLAIGSGWGAQYP